MGHDWILSVLSDLETYARQNGLRSLAGQLTDTALVARAEIATQSEQPQTGDNIDEPRHLPGEVGCR